MAAGNGATGVLAYLVNRVQVETRPRLFHGGRGLAAGAYKDLFGQQVGDDSIVLNQWLAEDLDAAVVTRWSWPTSYRVREQLQEKTTRLHVSRIVPVEGLASDPNLMPEFLPGRCKELS